LQVTLSPSLSKLVHSGSARTKKKSSFPTPSAPAPPPPETSRMPPPSWLNYTANRYEFEVVSVLFAKLSRRPSISTPTPPPEVAFAVPDVPPISREEFFFCRRTLTVRICIHRKRVAMGRRNRPDFQHPAAVRQCEFNNVPCTARKKYVTCTRRSIRPSKRRTSELCPWDVWRRL
jgi:hypothetical protein